MSGQPRGKTPTSGFFAELTDKFVEKDPNTIGIVIAILVIVITTIVFLWYRRRSSRRGVLILGSCDSGKTSLLSALVHQKAVETYTSMVENTGSYMSSTGKLLHLIDIPGHERVRAAVLEKSVRSARGVVYVVDSGTVSKQVKDVAEYLYKVLSDPVLYSNRPSVLVVCNKQDVPLVKSSEAVQALLEREITSLRIAHSRSLEGTDGENIDHVFLGKEGKDFEFRDLRNKVEFCEASAIGLESLLPVTQWLDSLA